MNQTTKWVIGIVVAALVIWGVVAMNKNKDQDNKSNTTAGQTYKVGVLGPMTGDAAVYGEPLTKVMKLAVDEINAKSDVKLELVVEDGKCNGKDAVSAMQKLVEVDKVQVVIGGFCSSESLAAIPVAEAAKVAMISIGSSSPDLTGKSKFFVRDYPSDASQGAVLAEIAYNKEGWKNVAFIQEQLDYPLGIFKAFKAKFESLGGTVTKEEFPSTTTDFRAIVTKVKSANPDALFVDTQAPAATIRIIKQVSELNWKPKMMVADILPGDPKSVSENKELLEGVISAEFAGSDGEKGQMLAANYKTQTGSELPYKGYSQAAYDGVYLVHQAIMAVGYDGEKIANWLRTSVSNWDGASGKVTIGSDGDLIGGHKAEIIMDGKVLPYTK